MASPPSPALFSRFDDIVIVAELTLQSLRDCNRLMKLLAARNREAKIHVIANQVVAKPDVTVKEFEAGMETSLRCVFPHDPKVMSRATLKGQPLATADPKHKLVAELHRLCIELAGVPEEVKARSGFFRRRARRLPARSSFPIMRAGRSTWSGHSAPMRPASASTPSAPPTACSCPR